MKVLKDLLSSKKFVASLVGVVIVLFDKLAGVNLPEDTVLQVVGIIVAFVVGQGIADHGKEANKVAADSLAPSDPS